MPESAVAESSSIETPPSQAANPGQGPLTAPPDPEMQARLDSLMKKVLPVEGDKEPEPTAPAKDEKEKPAAVAKDEPRADGLRLAPDLDAPASEPAKEPEVEITDEMIEAEPSPKKKADLKKFRESYRTLQTEIERLKTARPQGDANAPDLSAVVEEQKRQIGELSGQLERYSVQASPLFQQQLVYPRQQLFSDALATVKEAGGDPEAFEKAWHIGDAKNRVAALDEVVEDIKSPILRERVGRMIDGIDGMDRKISAALKDAKGTSERLRQQQTVSQHEQLMAQEKQMRSLLSAATQNLTDGLDIPGGEKLSIQVLKKTGRSEYKWWDDQVDDIHKTSEEILLKGTPQKMAITAVLAASCGPLNTLLIQTQRYAKTLEARLAAIDGADPSNLRGGPVTTATDEFAPDADITQVALARLRRGDFNKAA